jgi:hypothetical protein
MEDGAARGEAGHLTQDIDRLTVAAAPVDWSRVAVLAERLVKLAAEQQYTNTTTAPRERVEPWLARRARQHSTLVGEVALRLEDRLGHRP